MVTSREHLFSCEIVWSGAAAGPTASYDAYSREFTVQVPGKPPLVGSAAAAFRGDPRLYNPEDLLVAALASCHCLSYLAIAARGSVVVTRYEDSASGVLALMDGRLRFREVTLRPRVWVAGGSDIDVAKRMHHAAHAGCFIASSVNFPVRNEPTIHVVGAPHAAR
jgi:organic hydroperoxide reductase OsmC/OhrA